MLTDHVLEMSRDVTGRQPFGIQRNDGLIQPGKPALPDRHRHWFERPVPIPRHIDSDITDLGPNRFRVIPVAGVPRAASLDSVWFIAEVFGQLGLQRSLHDLLDQTREQAALTGQGDALVAGLINQAARHGRQLSIRRQHQRPLLVRQLDLGRTRQLPIIRHSGDPSRPTTRGRGSIRTTPTYTNSATVPHRRRPVSPGGGGGPPRPAVAVDPTRAVLVRLKQQEQEVRRAGATGRGPVASSRSRSVGAAGTL